MARRPTTTAPYRCTECGWTTVKWVGRCGECQQWGTVVEAAEQTGIVRSLTPVPPSADRAAQPITRVSASDAPRRTTGIGEFDRVLGGGLVPGAAILLSGEPGVGKSTLLLDVAAHSAASGHRVLYASAEESVAQVRLRASRTGALHDELYLASETDLATIMGNVDEVQPSLLSVDTHPRRERARPAGHHRRPRHEGRLNRRSPHPRAPRRRRLPLRGRPSKLAAIRPRAEEQVRSHR